MAKAGLDGDTGRSMHRAMAPVLCPKASAPAGGRATTLRTLALSATAALALAPTSSLAQPMPAPPTGSSTGPARTVAGFFSLYYGYAQDPDFCILSMRSARDAFRRTAALLPDIKGSEGSAFATYFHDVLVPHFAPMAEGVPGLGTYEQLVARRTESMAFLRASAPHGPARTPAEIAAYAEAERGYLTRVAADEAWVEEVFARGPCVRWGARRSSEIPWLGDFGVYRDYWVNEDKVRVRLREERAKHLPQMRGHGIGANLLAHHVAGPWTGASSLGTTLLSVAGAIKAIDDDRDAAATMAVWIAELEPTESAALAQAVAERDRVRAELVAVFDQRVGEMGLPEAATDDPVAAAHLRKLGLGKGALATPRHRPDVTLPRAAHRVRRQDLRPSGPVRRQDLLVRGGPQGRAVAGLAERAGRGDRRGPVPRAGLRRRHVSGGRRREARPVGGAQRHRLPDPV